MEIETGYSDVSADPREENAIANEVEMDQKITARVSGKATHGRVAGIGVFNDRPYTNVLIEYMDDDHCPHSAWVPLGHVITDGHPDIENWW